MDAHILMDLVKNLRPPSPESLENSLFWCHLHDWTKNKSYIQVINMLKQMIDLKMLYFVDLVILFRDTPFKEVCEFIINEIWNNKIILEEGQYIEDALKEVKWDASFNDQHEIKLLEWKIERLEKEIQDVFNIH